MPSPPPPSSDAVPARLARLNDAMRHMITRPGHNRVVMTDAVAQLLGDRSTPAGVDRLRRLFAAVRDFDRFTADNDPYGEHDFGRFELFGEALYWKIDYYDLACGGASPDATNPAVTCRVLTIMRVRDY